MSKKYRLLLMGISLIVLCGVGWFINRSFSFLISDFWFTAGLLLLVLLSLVDQPFFSKDSNIFVNAATAMLSLLLIPATERTSVFWCFLGIVIYLIISSYVLMWVRNRELSEENAIIQAASRLNRQIGKPETLFSAFFLWGAARQYTISSGEFNALLWFWVIFMLLNVPSIANTIERIIEKKEQYEVQSAVGKIFGVQSKNTFLVKLLENRTESLKVFDFVEFHYSVDNKKHRGIVLDVYLLNQEQWIKVLTTSEIDQLGAFSNTNFSSDYIYKEKTPPMNNYLQRFIGLVYSESNIQKIRFLYNSKVEIQDGQLIELYVGKHKVLYQVVQGVTKTEQLENKNMTGFIVGEAIQLGVWNSSERQFELFGWVPHINTPIFLSSEIEPPEILPEEFVIGYVPGTNYPVILNKEYAVTHHTAILGITGSGKSVFARNLINQIADNQTKVIVVDFTGEYRLKDSSISTIIDVKVSKDISSCLEALATEKAKFANQQDKGLISTCEGGIKRSFYNAIKDFLEGDEHKAVFELSEIINHGNSLEYTRWFLWVLFNIAKTENSFGKRVCVVLEEAHTTIPEATSMGVNDKNAQAAVNSIAQIALQGRKYNIGFIVIAQRTANVSKTVLTQCNSIIAFQELDKTTADFLSNYMGEEYIKSLPTLKSRTAIAMGKAFRSNTPMMFKVPDITES